MHPVPGAPDQWTTGAFPPVVEGVYNYQVITTPPCAPGSWETEGQYFHNVERPTAALDALPAPLRCWRRAPEGQDDGFRVVAACDVAPVPEHARRLGISPRPLFCLLPPSYMHPAAAARCYPVLYALDGENVFSTPRGSPGLEHGGWWADLACQGLWDRGEAQEFILVGVPSGGANRSREYCGAGFGAAAAAEEPLHGPTADPFLSYLVLSVKRTADALFRTLPGAQHCAVLGSSLGGLAAWRAASALPRVFGAAACLSPSLWFTGGSGVGAEADARRRAAAAALSPSALRVYLDSGDSENDNAFEALGLARTLLELGWVDRGRDGQALLPCPAWLPSEPLPPLHAAHWACAACTAHNGAGLAACSACGGSSEAGEAQGSLLYVFDRQSPAQWEPVGSHCEPVWAHRCARALRFLLPPLQPGS